MGCRRDVEATPGWTDAMVPRPRTKKAAPWWSGQRGSGPLGLSGNKAVLDGHTLRLLTDCDLRARRHLLIVRTGLPELQFQRADEPHVAGRNVLGDPAGDCLPIILQPAQDLVGEDARKGGSERVLLHLRSEVLDRIAVRRPTHHKQGGDNRDAFHFDTPSSLFVLPRRVIAPPPRSNGRRLAG